MFFDAKKMGIGAPSSEDAVFILLDAPLLDLRALEIPNSFQLL